MDTDSRAATTWSIGSLLVFVLSWLWLSLAPESVVMRESVWAFPAALTVHLLGLVLFVGMRLAIDLRMTGWAFGGVAASQLVRRAAPWSLIGAIVTVVSGMALYSTDAARMAANPVFQIKLAALAAGAGQRVVLSRRARPPHARLGPAAAPPAAVQASAYLSLALWTRDPGRRPAHAVRLA